VGATVPTGDTEFQFQVANFDFHGNSYQWMVVSGAMAQYKGSGTINGTGSYNFLLTALDGSLAGNNTPDGFRIKITDPTAGNVIYDNLLSTDDSVQAKNTEALGSGSIIVHSKSPNFEPRGSGQANGEDCGKTKMRITSPQTLFLKGTGQ
jgi:hypothetical protein